MRIESARRPAGTEHEYLFLLCRGFEGRSGQSKRLFLREIVDDQAVLWTQRRESLVSVSPDFVLAITKVGQRAKQDLPIEELLRPLDLGEVFVQPLADHTSFPFYPPFGCIRAKIARTLGRVNSLTKPFCCRKNMTRL